MPHMAVWEPDLYTSSSTSLPVTECQRIQEGVKCWVRQPSLVKGRPWSTDGRGQSLRSWGRPFGPEGGPLQAITASTTLGILAMPVSSFLNLLDLSILMFMVTDVTEFTFKCSFLPLILLLALK